MAVPTNPVASRAIAASPAARARPAQPAVQLRLSIVVVNYRQWESTYDLVRQLLSAPAMRRGAAEIVIVDNDSPKHPALGRLRRMAHVSVVRWNRNEGFARAVNEGCRLSRGDWYLLLNPDISLPDDFIARVLETLERFERDEPRAGAIGFHLRNTDGTQQLSTGPLPTFAASLARLALPRRRRKYARTAAAAPCQVPWATGCCLLLRGDCIKDLDGLDERFFLYYEDVDLCLRARQRGWSVWYDPGIAVVHHHPLHARLQPAALRCVTRHSLLTFAEKHWPGWQARWLTRLVGLEGRLRAWWSAWRGDAREARVFRELSALAADFRAGSPTLARARLEQIIRRLDLRVGV